MKAINKLILFTILLLTFSCGRRYQEEDLTEKTLTKEDSIRLRNEKIEESLRTTNQIVIKKELEKIKSYIERNSWKVKEKDGIFIEIISKINEKKLQNDEIISLSYECFTLKGEKLYDSEKDGKLNIRLGKDSECPLGLQKALLHLYHNCKARIIIPSSLAYGLSGDGKRIPPSTTLIYEVEID
ncbi:MAG: FKBP-type peptidyl-prolyl cis-trans isomerase [Bacteroidales bacterium]|jgi:FKBP-type peptidyl-prolyl cis-trans isomerase|nr:FKBP-type peptidyl-prolyl cis-trans isomerase [Bacteroidales bacterium]